MFFLVFLLYRTAQELMILPKKILFVIVLCTIFTLPSIIHAQSKYGSYDKLWLLIDSDTVPKEKKLFYLDSYIEKAHTEKNIFEEYRALEKKTYLLTFNQAVILLHKMNPLVHNLKNDSLQGRFYNRSTTLYYKNRYFKEALDYAIQAEKFNEQTNNHYNLNAARVTIGNIYFHTQYYEKAKQYFLLAKNYYKSSNDYNHVQGYVSSLYSLGKCYWILNEHVALKSVINESENMLPKLKPQDRIIEAAYINYIKGGNAFLQKDYNVAEDYFESALPEIQKNEDVSNTYMIYLYLGKIRWEQNLKEEAITYFTKIDELFKDKKFLNYELRDAYNYLRTYYKDNGQTELQLQATESLIALNQQFEKEQQYLTDVLHYQLETHQLQAEKIALQKQLKNKNKIPLVLWLVAFASASLVAGTFVVRKFRNKKMYTEANPNSESHKNNTALNVDLSKEDRTDHTDFQIMQTSQTLQNNLDQKQYSVLSHKQPDNSIILTSTEKRLMREFKLFEAKKEFKKTITLEQLAAQFGTNRTTLSNFLNTHKGGYNNYLSKLRVAAVVADLKTSKNLSKKTLQEISIIYGFSNAKAFSSQFKSEMNKSPLDYIKQLKSEIEHSKNTIR